MRTPGKVIPFPRSPLSREAASLEMLVEVRRCRDQSEALIVRGLLDSEGIPSVLRGTLVQSLHPFSVGEQAELCVLVHRADVARAKDILTRPVPESEV
jgi:Putative prokaryotic signal transducing protein